MYPFRTESLCRGGLKSSPMEFKSHEEVVLPADEAAKKRARDAARAQQPTPLIREIHIPSSQKKIRTDSTSVNAANDGSVIPWVPVREIQISAEESNIEGAAASLTPGDPVEDTEIQPKILNAGIKLLNMASRQGSPGGRLVRSSQHARASDEFETPLPRKPAAKKAKPTPKVKVESVGKMQFPAENVAEVATLQAPPPVGPAPESPALEIDSREFVAEMDSPESIVTHREIALQILANPGDAERVINSIPQPCSDAVEQLDLPEPVKIDSKKFVEQLNLPKPEPEPEPVKIDSREFVEQLNLPEPGPGQIDSRKVPEEVDLPDRERVIAREHGRADLVWEPPGSSTADGPEKPAKKAKGKTKRGSSHHKPYRDFIIAYDGVFIGHFRARKRILNRTAFQQVARQMHSITRSFDVRKLQLYRPVPIEVKTPDSLPGVSDGAFMWFSDRQPSSPDPS